MRFFAAKPCRAFTLVELLVVLAIISVLAGILFPVFASVKRVAVRTQCLTNFANAGKGTFLYTTDYDDRLMPINHRPGMPSDPVLDRTWPQILLPYVRDFRTFDCPAQPNSMEFGGAFDPDLLPGDYAARYYTASLHSDLGYNAYYLSPISFEYGAWVARPRTTTEFSDVSNTLLFVESGTPDAGSYIVSPPCRYVESNQGWVDTFAPSVRITGTGLHPETAEVYAPVKGWNLSADEDSMPYGGVWMRHGNRLNTARLDGSVKSMSLGQVTAGCDVRPTWGGAITNIGTYLWFPNR